ncbi:hypothetical protein EBR56_10160 [bacterium]|nr:hypothetical protein [bacterium]
MLLVSLPIGENHDDQRPLRPRELEPGLTPKIHERVVEPLEQCGTPLCVGPRGVEADDVVPRCQLVETPRQRPQDLVAHLSGRR